MEVRSIISNPLDQGELRQCGTDQLISLAVQRDKTGVALCKLGDYNRFAPFSLPGGCARVLFADDELPCFAYQRATTLQITWPFQDLSDSIDIQWRLQKLITHNGRLIGVNSHTTTIWDLALNEIASIPCGGHGVAALDDERFVIWNRTGTLAIWDGSDEPAEDLEVPRKRLYKVEALEGKIIAHFGGLIRIYDTNPLCFTDLPWQGPLRVIEQLPNGFAFGGDQLGIYTHRQMSLQPGSIFSLCWANGHLFQGLQSGEIICPQNRLLRVGDRPVRTLAQMGSHIIYSTDDELGSIAIRR